MAPRWKSPRRARGADVAVLEALRQSTHSAGLSGYSARTGFRGSILSCAYLEVTW